MAKAKVLSKAKIEILARIVWEQTGEKEPVCPPGVQLVDAKTGDPLDPATLKVAWENVGPAKDIYRRIAAAVAVELGYKLSDDVTPNPREIR